MLISERARSIKASPSSQASQRAREIKASGTDLISLTVGEPDFKTPVHIIEAAYNSALAGKTRYTDTGGIPELRAAICQKLKKENNLDYEKDAVIASTGAKQAIFNALFTLVNPGDEVIIPSPYWVSYPDMVKMMGGVPVIIDTNISTGFKITAESLQAHITEKTKCLFINSPSNPTGAVYSRKEIQSLITVLHQHPQIIVISDEVYEHIIYDDLEFVSFAAVDPAFKDRVLTVNAVSKSYAMTGWRLGYTAGAKEIIKAMSKVQSQSTSSASTLGQYGATAALTGDQSCRVEFVREYTARRQFVIEKIEQIQGLSCPPPEGAFYAFISCEGLIGKRTPSGQVIENDIQFVEHLISHGVFLIPGEAYGTANHVRLSFATSLEELGKGMERIAQAVEALQ